MPQSASSKKEDPLARSTLSITLQGRETKSFFWPNKWTRRQRNGAKNESKSFQLLLEFDVSSENRQNGRKSFKISDQQFLFRIVSRGQVWLVSTSKLPKPFKKCNLMLDQA